MVVIIIDIMELGMEWDIDQIKGPDILNLQFHIVKVADSCYSVNYTQVGLIMVSFSHLQYLYSYRNILFNNINILKSL